MSAEARANGWRGFDIGEKVERGEFGNPPKTSGWLYRCDGMPTMMGCGQDMVVTRRWSRVGKKKSGWLVCFGLEAKTPDTRFDDPDGWVPDEDVVLTFCPKCAAVVEEQEKARQSA